MAEVWNVPVPFEGTEEEKRANYATHNWHTEFYGDEYGETRCWACDCKPWHKAADYPCGTEPPRTEVTVGA